MIIQCNCSGIAYDQDLNFVPGHRLAEDFDLRNYRIATHFLLGAKLVHAVVLGLLRVLFGHRP